MKYFFKILTLRKDDRREKEREEGREGRKWMF